MGIYIPGLDAPEKCNGCWMNLSGHCLANKGLYVGRDNLEYNSKPDWCPAMNIQPHGRLIDADALENEGADVHQDIEYCGYVEDTIYGFSHEMIENAPTIIPAEGGGTDHC